MKWMWMAVAALLAGSPGAWAAAAAPEVPAGAQASGAPSTAGGKDPLVRATLLANVAVAAPGAPVRLGVLLDIAPDWHLYWRNSGQAGLATQVEWTVPGGQTSALRWPAPHVFREADGFITTYGYADQVLLASDAVFADAAESPRALRAAVDFLVCKVRCIPGRIELARALPLAEVSAPADAETLALFERYAALVPVSPAEAGISVEAVYSQSAIRPGDSFRAGVAVVDCDGGPSETCGRHTFSSERPEDAFVPDTLEAVEIATTGARPHPYAAGGFVVTLAGRATPDEPKAESHLRGVLGVRGPDGVRYVDVDLPFPRARAGAAITPVAAPWLEPPARAGGDLSFWRVLAFALLGGLILNLMPCVLPVLAIKAFGLIELSRHHRSQVLAHGAAYTAGILCAMFALAGTVVALRAAGVAVGWGFQFQEPLFVAAISAVLVVFALNLFGVFELSFDATRLVELEQRSSGLRKSFFEGLLAVVVATPCSAPFLGTAVGFAFAGSTALIFAIFAAIGIGLAAPFVVLTLVPAWSRLLPRGGTWMDTLRGVLGFALLGTVLWLVSVMGSSAGPLAQIALLAFLLAVAFAAWLFGTLRQGARGALAAFAVGGAALVAFLHVPLDAPSAAAPSEGIRSERAFEPAAVQAALGSGKPAFVYFTADWCLTCKVNEHAVLSSDGVQAAVARLGVATFKADWTRRDDGIRQELARFGRAGVPMYLVYSPRAPASPELLPELLTVDMVVDALEKAAAAPAGRS